jgi:protein SCO1
MSSKSRRILLFVSLALFSLATPAAAEPETRLQAPASPAPGAAGPSEVAATPEPAATSIKPEEVGLDEKLGNAAALDLTLRDEQGNPVALRSLVDRPTILTLNYFRCGGICSPQLNGLARALSRTNAKMGTEFRVITVSFDERDTAEIAANKQQTYLREVKRDIQPADWRFLTGDAQTTRRLSDSVGFKFKRVGNDFVHAGALMILSPEGKITRYMYGTSYLPADLELAVREAQRGEVQPTISKWLKFCFSYDPEGRKYMLNTTRVAGTFVIGSALVFAVVLLRRGRHSRRAPPNEPSNERDA